MNEIVAPAFDRHRLAVEEQTNPRKGTAAVRRYRDDMGSIGSVGEPEHRLARPLPNRVEAPLPRVDETVASRVDARRQQPVHAG